MIYFTPIISCKQCSPFFSDNISYEIGNFYSVAFHKGFKLANRYYAISPCYFHMKNSFVISPEGFIYKCLAIQDSIIGSIFEGIDNEKQEKFSRIKYLTNGRLNCVYLPLCLGGCRAQSYMQYHDLSKIVCPINIFEKVLPEVVKANALSYLQVSKGEKR